MSTIIETQRLILREFALDDVEDVFEFASNWEVAKYTGDPLTKNLDEARKIITDIWFKDYKTYGYGRWATIYKPDNKLIGFAGLKYLPEDDKTDLGFRFLPKYWNKGLATEASNEILKYGFEKLNLETIYGFALPENIGSCRVLEKVGMIQDRTKELEYDGQKFNWYEISRPPKV